MKLGIIGSGMIVNDLLSFVESIENIELVAILGREKSREKIEKIVNQHHIQFILLCLIIFIMNIQKKHYYIINM